MTADSRTARRREADRTERKRQRRTDDAPATTAGWRVAVRGRRVYLVDVDHHRDPGMSHHEARELAQRLLHAAAAAERHHPRATPDAQPPSASIRPARGRRDA